MMIVPPKRVGVPGRRASRAILSAARTHRIYVIATFLEKAEPKPFNAALLIAPGGDPVLHHRKVHICDFDSPELARSRGTGFSVCDIETGTGPVRVGLMICMDREYPEAARSLSRQGAEIALVPNCCDLAADPVCGDVRIAQARGRAFETAPRLTVAAFDIAAIRKARSDDPPADLSGMDGPAGW
jgi:predicted amidohydrolase